MASQHVQYIDVRDQQNLITSYPPDAVDELYTFGQSVWSASQGYSGQIDSKLSAYLGYSATKDEYAGSQLMLVEGFR